MNLGTMKTALRRVAGVDSGDPLTDWINAGMRDFEEAYDWPFLEASEDVVFVVGGGLFTQPTDMLKVEKIRMNLSSTSTRDLRYKPRSEFEEMVQNKNEVGVPAYYTLTGTNLITVFPFPDQAYTARIYYIRSLPDLVADVDVPEVDTRYHYTIVRGAVVVALEAESEEGRAGTAGDIFEKAIDRHIRHIGGRRQAGQFNQTRDVMGYG